MKQKHRRIVPPIALAALAALTATLPAQAQLYQSTVIGQGPVAYYQLNETLPPIATVTTAANLGTLGTAENGTYNGTQGFFRGYPGALATSDTAAMFNAGDRSVTVPYAAALNPTSFTVEAWLAPPRSAASARFRAANSPVPAPGGLSTRTVTRVGT